MELKNRSAVLYCDKPPSFLTGDDEEEEEEEEEEDDDDDDDDLMMMIFRHQYRTYPSCLLVELSITPTLYQSTAKTPANNLHFKKVFFVTCTKTPF